MRPRIEPKADVTRPTRGGAVRNGKLSLARCVPLRGLVASGGSSEKIDRPPLVPTGQRTLRGVCERATGTHAPGILIFQPIRH